MKKFTNDHRTRITRMLIRQSFTALLQQKPIQSITISELCQRAGINRGTFYSHYTDIYDLLQQIEAEMVEDFKTALHPLSLMERSKVTLTDVTTAVFQCIAEHSDFCIVTLGEYGDKRFAQKLISLGRELCLHAYRDSFQHASPSQIEYFYSFVSAGCIGLLQKWFADGLTESPALIAKMAENIMVYGIHFLDGTLSS